LIKIWPKTDFLEQPNFESEETERADWMPSKVSKERFELGIESGDGCFGLSEFLQETSGIGGLPEGLEVAAQDRVKVNEDDFAEHVEFGPPAADEVESGQVEEIKFAREWRAWPMGAPGDGAQPALGFGQPVDDEARLGQWMGTEDDPDCRFVLHDAGLLRRFDVRDDGRRAREGRRVAKARLRRFPDALPASA
jgi:hypothetical protein